jgi:hypothetical protein
MTVNLELIAERVFRLGTGAPGAEGTVVATYVDVTGDLSASDARNSTFTVSADGVSLSETDETLLHGKEAMSETRNFTIGGRTWSVSMCVSEPFVQRFRTFAPYTIAIVASLVTLVLMVACGFLLKYTTARTSALEEREAAAKSSAVMVVQAARNAHEKTLRYGTHMHESIDDVQSVVPLASIIIAHAIIRSTGGYHAGQVWFQSFVRCVFCR